MIPYRKVARDALINWNGLSEEEATSKAMTESIESLEGQVWAMSSIKSAVEGLSTSLNLTEEESQTFQDAVINGPEDAEIFKIVMEKANQNSDITTLILDDLSHIHDNWVRDNSSEKTFNKKVDREQLRQYAPLEIIGWNEAKSDLLFLNPILESIGVYADSKKLEQAYHERAEEFIKENGTDFETMISKGRDFYPALTEELAERLKPLASTVAKQIENNIQNKDIQSAAIVDAYKPYQNSVIHNNGEQREIYDETISTPDEPKPIDLNQLDPETIKELEQAGLIQTENNENQISTGKTM